MKTIEINTGRPYMIKVEEGLLDHLPQLIYEVYAKRKPSFAIITDDTVDMLYSAKVMCALRDGGYQVCKFVFPHGEASKNLSVVHDVYSFLCEHQITRTDVIIALGGGVVGDLAGFAAATYLRGIDFIQIPTTFLAMIDSSVGGKTGVDIPQGKNLIGAFWQPVLVVCDPLTLTTLPAETYADGIAEAVKYGAILDEKLFGILENNRLEQYQDHVICRCIELKKQVVEQDERDQGQRQCLNFGHTFGHAIEKYSNFSLSHGKGVAIGMVMMAKACENAGITPAGTSVRLIRCLNNYHLPCTYPIPLDILCENCMGDKKRSGSKITLCVLKRIGEYALYPIEAENLSSFAGGGLYE